ncbi:hypothetical protein EYC80_008690 [Monilinia laxa]|uniref:GED domain-containing protein n=1 Tax=Monilinia laxa TaxID=61186 RepID=A0A5N6K1I2_MONLA|nr:hypothetical protein EYC80_008690 [Monilinia laxa]
MRYEAEEIIRLGFLSSSRMMTNPQGRGAVSPFVSYTDEAKLIPGDDGMTWAEKLMKATSNLRLDWIRQVIEIFRRTELPGDLNPFVIEFLWRKQTTGWKSIAETALADAESILSVTKEVTSVLAKDKAWMNQKQGGALIPNLSIPSDKIVGIELYHDEELALVLNTHNSLEAYYELFRWRLTDNVVLQVIERHLLGSDGPLRLFSPQYVSEKLYGEQNEAALNVLVGENPSKAQKWLDLDTERCNLEESMKRLQAFKML